MGELLIVVEEFMVVKDLDEGFRRLKGKRHVVVFSEGAGGEGVGAMVEHFLGKVRRVDVSLDAQVAEHGVGFPSSEEHDDVGINVGTEESCSATGAEAAGGHQGRVDPCLALQRSGTPAQAIGDPFVLD